jgi:predicted phosphoribosyltransferase
MMARLITEKKFIDKIHVFEDRYDAGKKLAEMLMQHKKTDSLVLAIPSGGVPVAFEIAQSLNLPMDLILVRKVQIPWNTEAGFGALNPDGEVILNKELLNMLNLSNGEIDSQVKKTRGVLDRRNEIFRRGKPFPDIQNKTVVLVDDGLASGFTMLSALRFVKKRGPQKVIVAVPTGSSSTVKRILEEVDELVCLNIRSGFSFAVADAYMYWHDLSDEEVISLLKAG